MGKSSGINTERLKGVAISYCVTAVNLLANLLLVPLYLKRFGIDLYGLYQYIYSIAQYAVILDFGISSVMTKFIKEFDLRKDEKSKENIAFYSLIIVLIAFSLILIATVVVGFNMNELLLNDRPVYQQEIAHVLLWFMALQFGLALAQNYFDGALLAFEDYFIVKLFAFIRAILKICFVLALMFLNVGILSIILGDVIATAICVSLSGYRAIKVKHLRVKYHYWDRALFLESMKLSYALMLQSIVTFANNYVDKIVLGKMINNAAVTMYGLAMTFNGMFCEIPTVIQRLYLPESVRMIENRASGDELSEYVGRTGRFQFMLCGAIFGGFVLFGREFIALWSGKETLISWNIAVILMLSSLVPIVQNVCLTILTALNKRAFRSYMLLIGIVVNIAISIPLVRKYGVIGAPSGTVVSSILFNWIGMNIYYSKVIHLNIAKMFKIIIPRIGAVLLATMAICYPLNLLFPIEGYITFFAKAIVFCIVYAILLYKFGLTKDERDDVIRLIKRKVRIS